MCVCVCMFNLLIMIKLEQKYDVVKHSFCLYWKHDLFGYNTSCTRYDNVYPLGFLCNSLCYNHMNWIHMVIIKLLKLYLSEFVLFDWSSGNLVKDIGIKFLVQFLCVLVPFDRKMINLPLISLIQSRYCFHAEKSWVHTYYYS